jgi:exopolyphosphatase/guanosine-5'-triphosphate,3'-diphosphate pyrophosphatase
VNRATIDIGTNTILLLVVSETGEVLHDEPRVVGLGHGIGERGMLRPKRMESALEVLGEYARIAEQHGVPAWLVRAVATSGARRAMNARAFLERVREQTGLRVRIISGEEEAWLTWAGARSGLSLPSGKVAVVDPGGGSTELVMGEDERMAMQISLEIGTVRLTEQFLNTERYRPQDLARMRSHIKEALAPVEWPSVPRALIGVAGTVTTLAAMEHGLTTWDRTRVHGTRLSRRHLRSWMDRLLESTPAQRREWAVVAPERADYLLAGACLLEEVCTAARRDSLYVSDGGVRYGLLSTY